MLKNFVEKQRERERSGFYRHHQVESNTIDYEEINRKKQILSNLPAYLKDGEAVQGGGRSQYIQKTSQHPPLYPVSDSSQEEDIWKKAKNDPELRRKLYTRPSMKSKALLNKITSKYMGREVSERRILEPPPKVIPVDSDRAKEEYYKKTLLADRDPNWKPIHRGPLFKREQHVFLPIGTDNIIQQSAFDPVKQRKPNILPTPRPHDVPNLHSQYPADFNPDVLRHKPKFAKRGEFLYNPEYYEMWKAKVEVDANPVQKILQPSRTGGVDGEERFYAPNVGIPSGIDAEAIPPQINGYFEQKPIQYEDGNQTLSDIYANPVQKILQPSRTGGVDGEERFYAPNVGIPSGIDAEVIPPQINGYFEQKPIQYEDGNQTLSDIYANPVQKILQPSRTGGVDGEERFYAPNVGIPSGIDAEVIPPQINGYFEQKPIQYEDGNQTLSDIYANPLQPRVKEQKTFQERYYKQTPKTSIDGKSHSMYDLSSIHWKDPEYQDSTRNALDIHGKQIHTPRNNGLIYKDPEYKEPGKELDVYSAQKWNPKSLGGIDGNRIVLDQRKEYESNAETKSFKTITGLVYVPREYEEQRKEFVTVDGKYNKTTLGLYENPREYHDATRNEIHADIHNTTPSVHGGIENKRYYNDQRKEWQPVDGKLGKTTLGLLQNDPNYKNSVKVDVSMEQKKNSQNMMAQTLQTLPFATHSKVDINGKKFITLDSRALVKKEVQYAEQEYKPDMDAKIIPANPRTESMQQYNPEYSDTPKLQVYIKDTHPGAHVGLEQRRTRDTLPFQNADMDIPRVQGARLTRIKKGKPKSIAPTPKIDYEDPTVKNTNRQMPYGGVKQKMRTAPMTPRERPDIIIPGLRAPGPKYIRKNASVPSTPRIESCKKNDLDIERSKKYLNLPEPF